MAAQELKKKKIATCSAPASWDPTTSCETRANQATQVRRDQEGFLHLEEGLEEPAEAGTATWLSRSEEDPTS